MWWEFTISGKPAREHEHHAMLQTVSRSFFRAVGLNLLEGRGFTEGDRESSIPVAIISEKLAKMYWPGESPIGDRKSTRLNSSHRTISYAVFCLKKKKKKSSI